MPRIDAGSLSISSGENITTPHGWIKYNSVVLKLKLQANIAFQVAGCSISNIGATPIQVVLRISIIFAAPT